MLFKTKRLFCYYGVAFFVACLLPQLYAKADEKRSLFIQQLDKLQNIRLPLNHPDNPFHLYLDKRFENGLNQTDKLNLRNAQLAGNCFKVNRLVEKGFLQLYPFLKPIFKSHPKAGQLTFMIEYSYRNPSNRCMNYKHLNNFKRDHDLKNFPPLNMKHEITQKFQRVKRGDPKNVKDELISILFGFGKNAFCNDDPSSIGDVLKMAHQPGGMVFTTDEELYLTERAHQYGIYNQDEYDNALQKLKPKHKALKRFDDIRKLSQQKKIYQIDLINGFWQSTCKELLQPKKKKT